MKILIYNLIAVLLNVSAYAQNRYDTSSEEALAGFQQIELQVNSGAEMVRRQEDSKSLALETMLCIRRIAEKKLGGRVGIETAVEIADDLLKNKNNFDELTDIAESCEAVTKELTAQDIPRYEQMGALKDTNGTKRAKRIVERMLKPTTTCKDISIQAGISIIRSIGLKVEGSKCNATNGRVWIQVAAGVGSGKTILGAGATVSYFKDETDPEYYERTIFISDEASIEIYGFGGVASGEGLDRDIPVTHNKLQRSLEDGRLRTVYPGFKRVRPSGIGLGIFYVRFPIASRGIKIIPLGTDEELLLNYVYLL